MEHLKTQAHCTRRINLDHGWFADAAQIHWYQRLNRFCAKSTWCHVGWRCSFFARFICRYGMDRFARLQLVWHGKHRHFTYHLTGQFVLTKTTRQTEPANSQIVGLNGKRSTNVGFVHSIAHVACVGYTNYSAVCMWIWHLRLEPFSINCVKVDFAEARAHSCHAHYGQSHQCDAYFSNIWRWVWQRMGDYGDRLWSMDHVHHHCMPSTTPQQDVTRLVCNERSPLFASTNDKHSYVCGMQNRFVAGHHH